MKVSVIKILEEINSSLSDVINNYVTCDVRDNKHLNS